MCGIVGLAGIDGPADTAAQLVAAMNRQIRHRGPDGEGSYVRPDGTVALGMSRLAVLDVTGGDQPIPNEAGTVQVVFNGEIYNFRQLRRELESLGHRFATQSDTEVIVHGYEAWGLGVLSRLRGMFAIALWDEPARRLLLARDRLGIKPLYLWPRRNGLAFASELKALHALPDFQPGVSTPAVLQYLAFGYVPDPLSAFEGVTTLPPGHMATWGPGQPLSVTRYWDPAAIREQSDITDAEAVRELRRLLEDSVRCHLEADVPLGAFLSGGLDSSAVVAYMARLVDRPVRTFTVGFGAADHDETAAAATVARHLGTDHTEVIMQPDIDGVLEELVLWFDEPFADSSALPTFLVSQLARRHVTVALSGDGGDELFGGYSRYRLADQRCLPAPARRILSSLAPLLPFGAPGRFRLANLGRTMEGRYAATVALPLLTREGGCAASALVGDAHRLETLLGGQFARVRHRDHLNQLALVDLTSYLPGDILTKVDRMSMKVSLEARVPLLDHALAEFAIALPSRLKRRDGTGKWVLREAIRPLVPAAVLEKRKQGFSVPLGAWFRGPLRHRLAAFTAPRSPLQRFVDPRAVHRVVREHLDGRRDHSAQLWRLLVLHLWLTRLEARA